MRSAPRPPRQRPAGVLPLRQRSEQPQLALRIGVQVRVLQRRNDPVDRREPKIFYRLGRNDLELGWNRDRRAWRRDFLRGTRPIPHQIFRAYFYPKSPQHWNLHYLSDSWPSLQWVPIGTILGPIWDHTTRTSEETFYEWGAVCAIGSRLSNTKALPPGKSCVTISTAKVLPEDTPLNYSA